MVVRDSPWFCVTHRGSAWLTHRILCYRTDTFLKQLEPHGIRPSPPPPLLRRREPPPVPTEHPSSLPTQPHRLSDDDVTTLKRRLRDSQVELGLTQIEKQAADDTKIQQLYATIADLQRRLREKEPPPAREPTHDIENNHGTVY